MADPTSVTQHSPGDPRLVPGHVEPGGPSLVWSCAELEIRKASVSAMDNNAYLLTDRQSGARLLIDAADDAARILELIREPGQDGELVAVVTTHRHWDHHRALPEVIDATGSPALAGTEDASGLPIAVDRTLAHRDTVLLGAQELTILALRGHTPGSIAVAWTDPDSQQVHVFTGDSLFPGGPGKTSSDADFTSLMDDLEERVFAVFGDDTIIYPGHGDNTTLGAERPHLNAWRERGW